MNMQATEQAIGVPRTGSPAHEEALYVSCNRSECLHSPLDALDRPALFLSGGRATAEQRMVQAHVPHPRSGRNCDGLMAIPNRPLPSLSLRNAPWWCSTLSRKPLSLQQSCLTGYLGGVVSSHLRIADTARAAIPVVVEILAWGGLYLRDRRIRQPVPFRRSA